MKWCRDFFSPTLILKYFESNWVPRGHAFAFYPSRRIVSLHMLGSRYRWCGSELWRALTSHYCRGRMLFLFYKSKYCAADENIIVPPMVLCSSVLHQRFHRPVNFWYFFLVQQWKLGNGVKQIQCFLGQLQVKRAQKCGETCQMHSDNTATTMGLVLFSYTQFMLYYLTSRLSSVLIWWIAVVN